MNFFGHVAVARWWSRDPAALFGAMLPDFVGMVAAAPPCVAHPGIALGVALHRATDDHFHRGSVFRVLTREGARALVSRGLRRGPALAAAHVGVELLVDCALGQDPEGAADFLAAVAAGAPARLAESVVWLTPAEAARYARLHAQLVERGLGVVDPEPARITDRVLRVLARRPRLAVPETARAAVAAVFASAAGHVAGALPELMARLREDLSPAFGLAAGAMSAPSQAQGAGGP